MSFLEVTGYMCMIEVHGTEVPIEKYSTLQRNMAVTRDFTQMILKLLVVMMHINRHLAHALIDTGSLVDFMSITLAEQLKIEWL